MPAPYYAHSGDDLVTNRDWQLLKDHLQEVADLAEAFAKDACPHDTELAMAARSAGMLHDLGKYQDEWQQYLKDAVAGRSTTSVPHAIQGAAYAAFNLDNPAVAWAVAGHHTGLYDQDGHHGIADKLEHEKAKQRKILELITPWAEKELAEFPKQVPVPAFFQEGSLRYEFWARVLFSILIDADRLNTEKHETRRDRPRVVLVSSALLDTRDRDRQKPRAAHLVRATALGLLNTLDRERQKRGIGRLDDLTRLRNRVFEHCCEQGRKQPIGFFDLTVPTGGGKTLSGMAFALAHAEQHQLRRIIVVIPYLSIIEQNAREYRQILGASIVIEHHSAVGEEEAKTPKSNEWPKRTPAELATENWDAPIIVTTSVQFLETLLASSTRRCRKLHNIARSVVIFDEAQTLPAHLLNPLMSVFRELVNHFGTSIVFSTATQPAFRKSSGLPEGLQWKQAVPEMKSILTDDLRNELFGSLCRVRYHIELSQLWTWDELVDRLITNPQCLCILNTRAQARSVWEKLRERLKANSGEAAAKCVMHLSSAMCAEHRSDKLGTKVSSKPGSVQNRLNKGESCWLISTQVVEAGVDIDFPCVFRALGPLDSIVQAAGRCNREGRLKDPLTGLHIKGNIFVFQPAEDGMPPGVYEKAAGRAKTFITGVVKEEQLATDPTVFARYFDELYALISTDAAKKGEKTIQDERAGFNFRTVGERAKVIQDGGTPVLVPYGIASKAIKRIRKTGSYDYRMIRKLQRYTVNVRSMDFKKLSEQGQITPLLSHCEEGPWVLDGASYHEEVGVQSVGKAIQDFLGV
jgi:CRISPR-associated endonuclease/helicase Cas3